MPDKLHRHFHWLGIGLYLVSLLVVSIWFRTYALKPLWMVWGIGTVLFFFGLTYLFYHRWRTDEERRFLRKVFWIALGIRVVYVVAIMFYYYFQTGLSMEYQAADSMYYHQMATYLSGLVKYGRFHAVFSVLHANTMGFSDQGYTLYLTLIYTITDNNILVPRLLKALMSAYMCVVVYKLASRSLDEKTGKLAAVMAVFLPQFMHYCGTYMKETEMVFLATLALERMDYLIRSKHYTFWNVCFPVLLVAFSFGFRTIIGMTLIFCFVVFVVFSDKEMVPKKTKRIILIVVTLLSLVFLFTLIGWEMYIIVGLNINDSGALVEKYQQLGMNYAEYASYKYMLPGAFTLPLSNLLEIANENQKMMNGTYFVKNYLAFFAMWCIVVAIRDRKCKNLSLIGSYTIAYVMIIAFSFAFNSERFHFPALPGLLVMAACAMTRFRKKDFPYYYAYCAVLLAAIVVWNYLKLAARGLIL